MITLGHKILGLCPTALKAGDWIREVANWLKAANVTSAF
jgi:hypothetical protein